MDTLLTSISAVTFPPGVVAGSDGFLPETPVSFTADGSVPFPQIIFRDHAGAEKLLLSRAAFTRTGNTYSAVIPARTLPAGRYHVQAEGCRRADIENARPEDWVKAYAEFDVLPAAAAQSSAPAPRVEVTSVGASPASGGGQRKLYFGIHKHMHQPYYRAADPAFWDGMCDEIFSTRAGAYRHFVNMAASQYQALPHAGLSMSWSGSLIAQLNRASREGLAHGAFGGDWKAGLAAAAHLRTTAGHSRAEFAGFGYFHPLMPLIPARNIKAQILRHRDLIEREFGLPASPYLFPPETAFHVRMIPALLAAGVKGVVYDSIHRYRACKSYPYAGREEGMLPPNAAEQENPAVTNWLQLRNVWAGSKIAPGLLRPEYIKYTDVDGTESRIIGIPAERYIGNEDARGGFGALVYPDVLGQVLASVEAAGEYDPAHPPFFLLHSDGDNYGGGTDSYYGSNTGAMVEWLKNDSRFELIAIKDYLEMFPPDPATAVHVEPGSWSGADNGDPQFMKWFSGYNNPYSPDLNSWAVLTALQNAVHTLEDANPGHAGLAAATELMLTAETSCYWYWTGQEVWDGQVTAAANRAAEIIRPGLDEVVSSGRDHTPPTIFPPWVTPENPGGETWGNNCLRPADRTGRVHTFIYDVAGIKSARLFLRPDAGRGAEREIPLRDMGPYPTGTGARAVATLYEADLPDGIGDVRYWITAEDNAGNTARSALERIFLA